jgi:hypothetical protein
MSTETKKGLASVWSDAADDTRAATVPCEVTYADGKVIITFDQTVDFSRMRETSGGNVFIALKGDAIDLNIVQQVAGGEPKERVMVTYPLAARLNFKLK